MIKLGDLIERITYYTGIQYILYKFIDRDKCGCKARQEKLNKLTNRDD